MSSQLDETISENTLPRDLLAAIDCVETVLIDVGGVLASDSWEWLMLTPSTGLAARLGLDRGEVAQIGKELWRKYSLIPTTPEEYWADFSARLSIPPPPAQLIADLENELIIPSPIAPELLSFLAVRGKSTGIISDNITFWYQRQAAVLDLKRYVSRDLVYLSYEYHRNKKADDSLFEIAATEVDVKNTLIVDDREHNVVRARAFGFEAVQLSALPSPF